MNNSNAFEKCLTDIINDYIETFHIKDPIIPEYRIVEDIAKEYLTLRPDILESSSISIESLNTYNGFTVPPKEIDGAFVVLINRKTLLYNLQVENTSWVGTIVHETTHVQDFVQYAKMIGANGYEEIVQYSLHGMFDLWTEVNARSKGYYFTRKYALGTEHMKSELLLSDIMQREIPEQWKLLYKNYHSTNNGYNQAYLVAQYIGRLYTLQQLYPNDFDDKWIESHFGVNDWMTNWFLFFKKYPTLNSAVKNFDEMKKILGQNFQGL